MKKALILLILLASYTGVAQDWQLDGTKYPNATNEGDTISENTKIPMFDNNGVLNYYFDVGDLGSVITGGEWGEITGDITNQTDLIDYFDNYVPLTRTLTAGNGIEAIGDLSVDRNIDLDFDYLDNRYSGGFKQHEAVKAATVNNISLSGTQTIDGVSVVASDRILARSQTDAEDNGIYVVASGAWTRATDFDTAGSNEIEQGASVFVEAGTMNAATGWTLSTAPPITVGTTPLTFIQYAGSTSYQGGDKITITGTEINHDTGSWTAKSTLSGASVISNINVDAYGHLDNWTTRNLSAGDVGALTTATGDDRYLSKEGSTSYGVSAASLLTIGQTSALAFGDITESFRLGRSNSNFIGVMDMKESFVFRDVGGGSPIDRVTIQRTTGNITATGDVTATSFIGNGSGLTGVVPTSRTISTGTGLTGGGNLTTNRTISANFGTTSGTILEGNWRPSYSDITGTNPSYTKAESDGKYLLNTTDELSGNLTVSGNVSAGVGIFGASGAPVRLIGVGTGASNLTILGFYESNGSTRQGYVGFGSNSTNTLYLSNEVSVQSLRLDGSGGSNGLKFIDGASTRTVWHSGNDGAGSGLDADLLDGINSTGFARMGFNTNSGFLRASGNIISDSNLQGAGLAVSGAGTFGGTVTASNFILSSDKRLKENFEDLGNGYYTFNYKKDSLHKKRYGVIAQEVEKYAPELVVTNEDGYKGVSYIDLLIKKQAELEDRVKMLEAEKDSDYYMYGVIVLLFGFLIYSKLKK